MKILRESALLELAFLALLAFPLAAPLSAQAPTGDWPMFRGDLSGTGHSPLASITPANVSRLANAWTYSLAGTRAPASQATPIVVGGVLYLTVADGVAALDPTTGRELWRTPVDGGLSRRGVAYWAGADGRAPRIFVMAGSRIVALEASNGAPALGFGTGGSVEIGIPYNSVPLVFDDVLVVGANTPPGAAGGIGNARAFSAVTGAKLWEFASVPLPGTLGNDTWAGDSWQNRTGANAWPFYFTVDEERELLYLPLASPIPFGYGGDRAGSNLFANSVVAVNVRTGAYVWHFQTIHHDLWDHDPPAPPVLFDIPAAGGTVPALGVTTKSGWLYILNRETGVPVFGVEERPVPQSDVPGERSFPTQPFPTTPPLARVSWTAADLVTAEDTSPEHAAACATLVAGLGELRNLGPFTPWAYRALGAAPVTTLLFPGMVGGPNWGGVAHDPASDLLFAFSQDIGWLGYAQPAAAGASLPYERASPRPSTFAVTIGGASLPCQKPPWGRLTAVNARTGQIAWERPLGITEQLPAGRQETGRPGRAAAIVTGSGLLFIAATDDARFRALDARTGRTLWETELASVGNANPFTYLGADGRQYVGIVATDQLVTFALR